MVDPPAVRVRTLMATLVRVGHNYPRIKSTSEKSIFFFERQSSPTHLSRACVVLLFISSAEPGSRKLRLITGGCRGEGEGVTNVGICHRRVIHGFELPRKQFLPFPQMILDWWRACMPRVKHAFGRLSRGNLVVSWQPYHSVSAPPRSLRNRHGNPCIAPIQ